MANPSSGENLHLPTMLLLGYATNTLPEEERQKVDQHLTECQTCRQELEEIDHLRNQVTSHFDSFPAPSPHVFERVKAITLEEEALQPKQKEKFVRHNVWIQLVTMIEEGIGALFIPRWAPSLAVMLIVVQAALLFGTLDRPPGNIGTSHSPRVVERSGSPTAPMNQGILVQIAFQEDASEKHLRTVIRDLEARIVNGPSIEGVYIVELLEKDPSVADQKLAAFLSNSSSVRIAKRINP
jgi:hypothetical protein